MAELADATDSKSVVLADVGVRPPLWVLIKAEQLNSRSALIFWAYSVFFGDFLSC